MNRGYLEQNISTLLNVGKYTKQSVEIIEKLKLKFGYYKILPLTIS